MRAIPVGAKGSYTLRVLPAQAQSQVIKIGHVSPKTGPLAGFGEADNYILEQVRGIGRCQPVLGRQPRGHRKELETAVPGGRSRSLRR